MSHFERLSALDASFLGVEDGNAHMHVAATLVFDAGPLRRPDGGLDFERIEETIGRSLARVPRYRQRIAFGPLLREPVWVDDERFNLHYHVRHTALPKPGDDRQLKRLSGRIFSQELDRGKPLWELWVVEGLAGDRFAIVNKAHHCMVDGMSGVDLLAATLATPSDDAADASPREAAQRRALELWRPRTKPGDVGLALAELGHRVAAPFALARAVGSALGDPRRALGAFWNGAVGVTEIFAAGLTPASETKLNHPIGPHRRFDWMETPLADLKEIRSALGGTVNDVVLAIVAGAVGRFLAAHGDDLDALTFRAMVPVSVRTDDQRGTLGNKVASLVAELPIAERDPRERLRRVRETTTRLKHGHAVQGSEILEEIADWTSSALLVNLVQLATRARSYNVVVTNVPGPPFPIHLLGAPLRAVYPMVPLFSNQALGIALFSYAGTLFWGLNADWDAVPDLHDFALDLGRELEALRRAASAIGARVSSADTTTAEGEGWRAERARDPGREGRSGRTARERRAREAGSGPPPESRRSGGSPAPAGARKPRSRPRKAPAPPPEA